MAFESPIDLIAAGSKNMPLQNRVDAFGELGTGKLREFCFPAISGRENCASFAFPLYRDEKTA